MTPAERWKGSRPLRPAPSTDWLKERFTIKEAKPVSTDHIIKKNGQEYEVPRGYAGERITVYRRVLEGNALYILHQGRFVQLHPVDKYSNAKSRRGKVGNEEPDATPHCKSSSTMAFEQTYGSILDADGGFSDPRDDKPSRTHHKE